MTIFVSICIYYLCVCGGGGMGGMEGKGVEACPFILHHVSVINKAVIFCDI